MLSLERLKAQLRYDPNTGLFWWLQRKQKRRLDRPAGSQRKDRRWVIRVDGRLYLTHQLAWFWMTGEWCAEIDHADTDPGNNRWMNLRPATSSQNKANQQASRRSTLGVRGVSPHKGGYRVRLQKDGQRIDAGVHPTIELATAAYTEAAARVHGQFARS